jgi:hypothetical protein
MKLLCDIGQPKRGEQKFKQAKWHYDCCFWDVLCRESVCCAPSMQPPQRMHIASVMKRCSGYVTCCYSYESTLHPPFNIPT